MVRSGKAMVSWRSGPTTGDGPDATVSPSLQFVDDEVSVERLEDVEIEVVTGRRTIVTALPLKRAARERLASRLDASVLDVREPCEHPDLVLTPPCSPQLVGRLKDKYDGARVVVVELDDWELGIELHGPVKRILRAGADAYLLADSLDQLADKLVTRSDHDAESDSTPPVELTTGATVDDLIAAFLRESVESASRVTTHAGDDGSERDARTSQDR
jgi:hypothetical protein